MIAKNYVNDKQGAWVDVSFVLPESIWATSVHVVGDFNGWDRTSNGLHRDRDGKWILTLCLEVGHAYQFRYLLDGHEWINDGKADGYVPNRYGSDNGLVITDPDFLPHTEPGEWNGEADRTERPR